MTAPKTTTMKLLILPGDGIGVEVMAEVRAEVRKVIGWYGANRGLDFAVEEDLVGGAAYDVHGVPLADATMARAQEVDAVLLGAVGGPAYDDLDFSLKPERGLLRLRKEMDLYANLRPAQCFDALADFSSLKREIVAGLDLMIARHHRTERRHPGRHQHPPLYHAGNPPRRPLGLRAGPQTLEPGLLDGEGQCDGGRDPVARGGRIRPRQ
jgi:isocitrate/isopropylmalate dehydrogenase